MSTENFKEVAFDQEKQIENETQPEYLQNSTTEVEKEIEIIGEDAECCDKPTEEIVEDKYPELVEVHEENSEADLNDSQMLHKTVVIEQQEFEEEADMVDEHFEETEVKEICPVDNEIKEHFNESEINEDTDIVEDHSYKSNAIEEEDVINEYPISSTDYEVPKSDVNQLEDFFNGNVNDVSFTLNENKEYIEVDGQNQMEVEKSNDKAINTSLTSEDNTNSSCEICNTTVYPLDEINADNHLFHKQCFQCTKCRCVLLAGNFSIDNDQTYCKPHYIELFKKRSRYDEIDDNETVLQSNINDILTDELPTQDITKTLLAKFRDLESGTGTTNNMPLTKIDGISEMPAPNTTKNLMERFSALGKVRDSNEPKRRPMIEIPRSEGSDKISLACENEPQRLPTNVVRSNEVAQAEMPEQGITKNLVNKFRNLENTGIVGK